MLGDNLIMSHQVNYVSSALFPDEAAENNQEHLVAMRLGRQYHNISLVTLCG